jgi:hypothetical protein
LLGLRGQGQEPIEVVYLDVEDHTEQRLAH